MNGVHCQVSPMRTIRRADQACVAQDHAVSPNAALRGAKGPFCMSASMRNMYATPTGVTISGMKKTTRKKLRARMGWAHSSASPRPIRNCAQTPTST